jgi:hypothetical protein
MVNNRLIELKLVGKLPIDGGYEFHYSDEHDKGLVRIMDFVIDIIE